MIDDMRTCGRLFKMDKSKRLAKPVDHISICVSCGAAPMQGNGAPETYAAPPSALLGPRRRPLGMHGKLSHLVARIE